MVTSLPQRSVSVIIPSFVPLPPGCPGQLECAVALEIVKGITASGQNLGGWVGSAGSPATFVTLVLGDTGRLFCTAHSRNRTSLY